MVYSMKKAKLKEYKLKDIYGDEYKYKTKNLEEAKECFEAENGKVPFQVVKKEEEKSRTFGTEFEIVDKSGKIIKTFDERDKAWDFLDSNKEKGYGWRVKK